MKSSFGADAKLVGCSGSVEEGAWGQQERALTLVTSCKGRKSLFTLRIVCYLEYIRHPSHEFDAYLALRMYTYTCYTGDRSWLDIRNQSYTVWHKVHVPLTFAVVLSTSYGACPSAGTTTPFSSNIFASDPS